MPRMSPAADGVEGVAPRAKLVDDLVLRKHDGERARDREHAERDDEARQPDIGNEKAVDGARRGSREKPGQ